MDAIASQITSLTIVFSTFYSDADQRKHQSSVSVTGLCAGNSPGTGDSPHKWPVTRKMFPFDDIIMMTRHIYRRFDDFSSLTAPCRSCKDEHFRCSQWRKFRQSDNILISILLIDLLRKLCQQIPAFLTREWSNFMTISPTLWRSI